MPDAAIDPLAAARRLASPALAKRFYTQAESVERAGRFALLLDGKPAKTPAGNLLDLPNRALGKAVAAEWNAQKTAIDPASMPATRLANTALDGVAPRMAEVRAAILAYAGADLLCYRAGEPEGLVQRQAQAWDPVLAWAERRFAARFILSEGIVHVTQPPAAMVAIAAALDDVGDPFRLAALNVATTLSGSMLIALALADGRLSAEQAWAAAHVDEDWNISRWGEDAEARLRRDSRFADFQAAGLALDTA